MKKVVAVLALLFGASVSVLAHADANQPASDNTQQSTGSSTPQAGDQNNSGSTDSNGSSTNPGTDSNSSSTPSSSDSDDEDTAS